MFINGLLREVPKEIWLYYFISMWIIWRWNNLYVIAPMKENNNINKSARKAIGHLRLINPNMNANCQLVQSARVTFTSFQRPKGQMAQWFNVYE